MTVKRGANRTGGPKAPEVAAMMELAWGKKQRIASLWSAEPFPLQRRSPLPSKPQSEMPNRPDRSRWYSSRIWTQSQLRSSRSGRSAVSTCPATSLIIVPDEILISRTGAPNKFRRPGVIKNVYRKNSSVVPRVFLFKPRYDSIAEVRDEIESHGGIISQATVSKSMAPASTKTS